MLNRALSLRHLLSPTSVPTFLAEHRGRVPLLVPGDAAKLAPVFSWAAFNRLLDTASTWTSKQVRLVNDRRVIAESEYCRPAVDRALGTVMRPMPQAIARHVQQGATVNINGVELLDTGLASVACSLAMAFATAVNCNIYASRRQVAAFPTHFDFSDVFVLHVAGEKQWRVYEKPFEMPADMDGYTNGAFSQEWHRQRHGRVLMQPVLRPGDVLYIPKGFYHDALATSTATLHVTFGIDEVRGVTALEVLRHLLPEDAAFRSPLPSPDDTGAHAAHLARLAERLGALLASAEVGARVRHLQKNVAFWSMPGFAWPQAEFDQLCRLRRQDATLDDGDGGAVLSFGEVRRPVAPADVPVVRWILDGDFFEVEDLVRHFPGRAAPDLERLVGGLAGLGLLEPIEPYAT